jgi:hypothetical protein
MHLEELMKRSMARHQFGHTKVEFSGPFGDFDCGEISPLKEKNSAGH